MRETAMSRSGSGAAESQPIDPSRVTIARQRRGLTMTSLARTLGVTPRTVSTYEREGAPAKAGEALAEALDVPSEFLRRPALDLVDDERVAFRARRRTSAGQRAAATAAGRIGIELYAWLLERFTVPDVDLPELDHDDPVRAASALRGRWGRPTGPVPNLVHLAEAHGVRVLTLPAGAAEVDAFSVWHDGAPYVFLTTSKTPERARFDLAHELGHLVLHSRSGGGDLEREADQFAAALLMPVEELRTRVGREVAAPQVVRSKAYFGVSAMALNRSLHAAGRMSDWTYRQNCVRLTQMGYRAGEPAGIARERSKVLRIVFDALRESGTTTRDVADALGLRPEDVHDLTFGLAMTTVAPSLAPEGQPSPQVGRQGLRLVRTT
ncbi:XRE family transcriptional regulator [uncultured Pseudokineococcus sp.]|uniref:XRE family transcriptional regulator n=1 Tax=uncultured Pseudokineococcus sp. TaxID=1642928 RepID=UPI0026128260|nr:XRE family transcriptional regulator [uncultured Pseudokineococcus sp.]